MFIVRVFLTAVSDLMFTIYVQYCGSLNLVSKGKTLETRLAFLPEIFSVSLSCELFLLLAIEGQVSLDWTYEFSLFHIGNLIYMLQVNQFLRDGLS